MYVLFEISDQLLMVIGLAIVLVLFIGFAILKVILDKNRVKPISEDERYDSEEVLEEKEVVLTEEQKQAKAELERVYAQMSADLEKEESSLDEIDEFERKQEEEAIISYKELMKQADRLKIEADKYEQEQMDFVPEKEVEPVLESHSTFRNSDIISPIYGIQKNKPVNKQAYKHGNPENNVEFLNSLKEFRKNL